MIVLGLTGSIGMGKSKAALMLRQLGIPVHDSDAAVHRLLAPGGRAVRPVLALFPEARGQGGVDRGKLAALVFNDPAQRKKLEAILHPLVLEGQQRFLMRQRRLGAGMAVLEIPLLYETGAETRADHNIVVTAPAFIQRKRVLARGLDEKAFRARLLAQMPDHEKRRRADFVVQTGLGLAYTRNKLKSILRKVRGKRRK